MNERRVHGLSGAIYAEFQPKSQNANHSLYALHGHGPSCRMRALIVNAHTLNRKFHYWAAALAALPVLVILCTGLLLQLKKQSAWVQPPEQRGVG